MGLRISQIFRLLLLLTLITDIALATGETTETSEQKSTQKYVRLPFPYPNYIIGLYPVPQFNISCSCTDPYENFVLGPRYGDGCELIIYGRPTCVEYVPYLKGCFCDNKNGWYRHPMTLKCVRAGECPNQFNYWNCGGKHEEYRIGDDTCKDTCDYHIGGVNCAADQCVPGCYCKKGYARSKKHDGECIPIYDCGNVDFNEITQLNL